MLSSIDSEFRFLQQSLNLRAQRQQLLASNVANADTPNYKAVDIDFDNALREAMGAKQGNLILARTAGGHLGPSKGDPFPAVMYRTTTQPSVDGNTVDMDVERAHFADNAVHYQAVLRFLNGKIGTLMTAIKGQ